MKVIVHFLNYISIFNYNFKGDCNGNEHRCKNGKCVSDKLVCNGNQDCSDESDEVYCDACKSIEKRAFDHMRYVCIPKIVKKIFLAFYKTSKLQWILVWFINEMCSIYK